MYIYSEIILIFAAENIFRITKDTIITMADWKNFYLQRMWTDAQSNPYPVKESVAEWGIFCKEIPFKIAEKVKTPAKRTWLDEHGDDEYIPSGGLYLEAYTMEVEFGCKKLTSADASKYGTSVISDVRTKVGDFITWLRTAGMIKIYSGYTRIGRQNVRLDSVKDKAKWKNEGGEEWLVFTVELKVNDPVTDVTLSVSSSSSSSSSH